VLVRFVRCVDAFTGAIGRGVAWLTVGMVLVVFANVASRYLFGGSLLALQELGWHLFGVVFLLGSPHALRVDRHVRVDLLYARWSARTQARINLWGALLLLLPFAILGATVSGSFVAASFAVGETSPDPGGLPARYLIKAMVPAGFALLALQALAEVLRQGLWLRGRWPQARPGAESPEEA